MADAATGQQMQAIAAGLHAAGLTVQVHDTQGVLDVTAELYRPGTKPTEVIIDEDHYVEVRYWHPPGATPDQVTGVIVRALATISAALRD
jgi:hypothetical protein